MSDISTETASSPITDHSQSSLPEGLQTHGMAGDPKEDEDLQEGSSKDNLVKELDEKVEIPKSSNEPVIPR